MLQFFLGGVSLYVNPGQSGIYVHDDMGDAVLLDPVVQFNCIEFAIDAIQHPH